MDTRLLYIVALVIVSIVGGFYYYSGKSQKLQNSSNPSFNSTAKNIQVIQTNEKGQLYAKAHIGEVEQWAEQSRVKANLIEGILYKQGQANSTFYADQAIARQDYEAIELLGNIKASQLSTVQKPSITFTTERLLGNTKLNQIETDHPVQVLSSQAQFNSQGMKADLNTGEYEFFAIRGKYDPSSQ